MSDTVTPLVIPATGAVPDVVTNTLIPTDWGNAIGAASRGRVVQRFNTTAERDSSITAPVPGMVCYIAALDSLYYYRTAGGWTQVPQMTAFYARAYRNGAFTISGTGVLTLDTANYDPAGCFNPSPGKFTCPVAGIYQVAGAMSVNSTAAGNIMVATLFRNGATYTSGTLANATAASQIITSMFTDLVQCAASDVLALNMGYNPFNLTGTPGSATTFLAVQYLHP